MAGSDMLFRLSIPALLALAVTACATSVKHSSGGFGGGGQAGEGGGGTSASGGTGTTSSTTTTTITTTTSTGPCTSAQDCASFSDTCNVGTCINGVCQKKPANDGTSCDDGKKCTVGDACDKGSCTGSVAPCPGSDACHVGVCDMATDTCMDMPGNDGAPCDDADPCTANSACKLGACAGGQPADCSFLDGECSKGACDPQKGCVAMPANDGVACKDGLFCTANDVCKGGVCTGSGSPCAQPNNDCMIATCNEQQKSCMSSPGNNGAACDDKNACTQSTTCNNGVCGGGQPANDGAACDDGDPCTVSTTCSNGACGAGSPVVACTSGDGCCPAGCNAGQDLDCGCFTDWLVGTPCNGVDFGNGCSPSDTGYHFVGIFDGYACFWHQKNQAWNTTTASNFYHLAQSFKVTPGVGRCHWCDNKLATPTPLAYDSCVFYFDQNNVGAWGWCAEKDPDSVGFVCIPTEGHPACK